MKKALICGCTVFLGAACLVLSGCGRKEMVHVVIQDGMVQTFLETEKGTCVADILADAEISLKNKDQIQPALTEQIYKDDAQIEIARFAKVTVDADGQQTVLEVTGQCVQDVLGHLGITPGARDIVNHSMGAVLTDGMEIHVVRRREIMLCVDGDRQSCITQSGTVERFLQEQGISLGKKDRISCELTKELEDGDEIVIQRVGTKKIIETEEIAFGTQTEYSSELYEGEMKEKRAGVAGKKEVTYRLTLVDGKEESRRKVDEQVIEEPVDQIIVQGTRKRRYVVSRQQVADCDGSGHGYYVITWSDGVVEYQDY